MKNLLIVSVILLISVFKINAQNQNVLVLDKDTLQYGGQLPTVTYYENDLKQYKYDMLRQRIKRLYPYAEIAKKLLNEINSSGTKKGTKTYVKDNEKALKDKFENELKSLTITEGQILVKLINRETGNNCYNLIKSLKGTFSAFTYQVIGSRYGYDLKQPYVVSENSEMEQAIKDLKDGGYLPMLTY